MAARCASSRIAYCRLTAPVRTRKASPRRASLCQPAAARDESRLRGGRQRGGDAVEDAAEVRAHQRHRRDDDHRDERRDQTVLDRRRAALVTKNFAKKPHSLPPAKQITARW